MTHVRPGRAAHTAHPARRDPAGDQPPPGLGLVVAADAAPPLPRLHERFLYRVLCLTKVTGNEVDAAQHPLTRAAIERIEILGVRHRHPSRTCLPLPTRTRTPTRFPTEFKDL